MDGAKLHIPKILRYQSIRLPTIGLLVTLLLGMGLIKALFPLSMMEAFVVMLPLLAIDGRVVDPAFSSHIPSRISQMLNVEGAFTGIFAFLSFLLFICLIPSIFIGIFFPLIAGSILGYICGLVGKTALECGWAQNNLFRGAFSLFLLRFLPFVISLMPTVLLVLSLQGLHLDIPHDFFVIHSLIFQEDRLPISFIFSSSFRNLLSPYSFIGHDFYPHIFAVVFLIVIRFLAVLISLQKVIFNGKPLDTLPSFLQRVDLHCYSPPLY